MAAMMIDGVMFAGQCCVVALAICTDGTKVPVGLWLGETENKTGVTSLMADLFARGFDASGGLLFVASRRVQGPRWRRGQGLRRGRPDPEMHPA